MAARWWSARPGPARVQQVIREALARGADRALHVEDDALGAADAFTAAAALAPAMAEEKFDLILTGLQSDDQGHAQFGPVLAEKLGDPALDDHHGSERRRRSSLRVKRELEGGWFQYVTMPLPALLTIQSGINQLRYATLKGIMAAKKKEITKVAPPAGRRVAPEDAGALRAAEVEADGDDRRLAGRSREGAGQAAARRGAGPMILVIAEQKDGKLNRASWEAIAAAQQLAGGAMPIKVAVAGQGVPAWPASWRRRRSPSVLAVDARGARRTTRRTRSCRRCSRSIEQAVAGATCSCRTPIRRATSSPTLATRARSRARHRRDRASSASTAPPAFARPMFQGKLTADVVPQGPAPHFVTIQIGAFRADAARKGGAPAPIADARP